MRSWFVLLAVLLLPAPAASDCLDYSPAFEYLGSLPPDGAPHAVDVAGNLAFVGTDSAGVQVVDATDPATPQVLATIPRAERTRGVSISGHLLAMAGPSGLRLADVGDPAAPQLLGSFATGSEAVGVVLRDSLAFLVDSGYGVLVIDCSNPDSLAAADSMHASYPAAAVAVTEDLHDLYLLDYLGIAQYQRNSLGHYQYYGRSNALDKPRALVLEEPPDQPFRIFVADATLGLVVFTYNINNVQTRAVDGGLVGIGRSVSLIHAVSGDGTLYRFPPADANLIDFGDNLSLPEGGALATGEDKTYVAAPGTGLEIVASHDLYLASLGAPSIALDTASPLLVTTAFSGTRFYDLTSPRFPVLLGSIGGGARDIEVQGMVAYLAVGSGLSILDLTDPSSPQSAGSLSLDESERIEMSGDHVFLTGGSGGNGGLHVVDVSDPNDPQAVTSLPTLTGPNDMFLAGPRLYLVNDDSLQVVDVADPAAPQILGALHTPSWYSNSVVASGGAAYVAAGTLQMVDVSDPQAPQPAGPFVLSHPVWRLAVDGPVLYVQGGGMLSILDISNPLTPLLLGTQPTPAGAAVAMAVGDDYAVMADNNVGTYILRKNCEPVTPVLLSTFEVREQADGVLLRWETGTRETAESFRLTGGNEAGSWDVPIRELGPGAFSGQDPHPDRFGGTHVTYTLEYRERNGTWTFLAERSLDLQGRGPSLPTLQAGPNPTATGATIAFEVSRTERARVTVFDLAGREVVRLMDADMPPGRHEVAWSGRDARGARSAAGVYIIHLDTAEGGRSVKLVVVGGR